MKMKQYACFMAETHARIGHQKSIIIEAYTYEKAKEILEQEFIKFCKNELEGTENMSFCESIEGFQLWVDENNCFAECFISFETEVIKEQERQTALSIKRWQTTREIYENIEFSIKMANHIDSEVIANIVQEELDGRYEELVEEIGNYLQLDEEDLKEKIEDLGNALLTEAILNYQGGNL